MSEDYFERLSMLALASNRKAVDRTVRFLLNRSGYVAATVECARRTLRELDEPLPHLVLSSWAFPAMNGTDMVEMLLNWDAQAPRKKHQPQINADERR